MVGGHFKIGRNDMGFSGYYQILCKAGHRSSRDCYDEPNFSEYDKVLNGCADVERKLLGRI